MSDLTKKTLFLLVCVFPSILDIFYKNKYFRYQVGIILKAGYPYIDKDNSLNQVALRELTTRFIEEIRGFKLKDIEVLLIFDNFCDEYLENVRKERRFLWQQMKQMIESNEIYVNFNSNYNSNSSDGDYAVLERAEKVFIFINEFIKVIVCHRI